MSSRRALHPLILDAGALIAFDRRDRRVEILVERGREIQRAILVPVGALAQVWRDGSRQAPLARLLNSDDVQVVELTAAHARAAGELCGRRGTSDVIDASIVILARETHGFIATGDPDDLRHLDPGVRLAQI